MLAGIALYPNTSRSGNPAHTLSIVMVYILIIISLFYAIAQPCKKKYMNNLESILYAFTGLSFLCINNANMHPRADGKSLRPAMANLFLVIQLLPSLLLTIKVIQKMGATVWTPCHPKMYLLKHDSSTDSLPDRIVHPNKYTPLLIKP